MTSHFSLWLSASTHVSSHYRSSTLSLYCCSSTTWRTDRLHRPASAARSRSRTLLITLILLFCTVSRSLTCHLTYIHIARIHTVSVHETQIISQIFHKPELTIARKMGFKLGTCYNSLQISRFPLVWFLISCFTMILYSFDFYSFIHVFLYLLIFVAHYIWF